MDGRKGGKADLTESLIVDVGGFLAGGFRVFALELRLDQASVADNLESLPHQTGDYCSSPHTGRHRLVLYCICRIMVSRRRIDASAAICWRYSSGSFQPSPVPTPSHDPLVA